MPAKKKKKCLVCLCLSFKTSLRITEVQHLLLFFRTSNQKVVLCTNEKLFFSLYFSFTRKQNSQQTNCFFFCKQNHFEMRNRNQVKKKLNWSFCFFVDSFCLLPPRQNKKTHFYKSEETIVHSLFLKFEKLF